MSRWWAVAGLGITAALACGSGPEILRDSYRGAPIPPDDVAIALHGAFVVPPDRSLVSIRISGVGATSDEATGDARTALGDLTGRHQGEAACGIRPLHYDVSHYTRADGWSASIEAVLDIDLTDLDSVVARMDRVAACVDALGPSVNGHERRPAISWSPPVAVVDRPELHLPELLGRRAEVLRSVTEADAPQIHAEDWRCVPTGAVEIGVATLSGVVLEAEVRCRIAGAPSEPAEE